MNWLSKRLVQHGINGTVKMNAFASEQNEIFIRFENLADDTIDGPLGNSVVKIEDIAHDLWISQNRDNQAYSVEWTEMNLSGTILKQW